jgi:SAM-dependent methyltransferase
MNDLKPDGPNSDQIEYWNGQTGEKWVDAQEKLDPALEPVGLAAMDIVGVNRGEKVIDLGCGCGATSLALAERVGPMGSVLGVDISTAMLHRAAQRAAERSMGHVTFANADASNYRFEEKAFDLAYSRFGVMFFRNPVEAFANIRRALRADGRLGFVCWQPLNRNQWTTLPRDIALRHVAPPEPPHPHDPGPFAFADPERVTGILTDAGFGDIAVNSHETQMRNSGTVDEVTHFLTYFGPASRLLAEADEATKQAVERDVREEVVARHDGSGLSLDAAMWIVTARA